MKKLLSVIAGFAIAIAAIAVVNGAGSPVSATSCTDGSKYTDFEGSYSGRDTMTVWTKGNKKLCKDVNVNFASFKVLNKNYNGQPFKNNPTALPQTQFYNKTVTLKKGTDGKTTVTVQVPDACTPYQIDAYVGPIQTEITTSEGFIGTNAIVGKLFQRTKEDCSEPKVDACNLKTKQIEKNVPKSKIDDIYYTLDLEKCKPKEDKDIEVCRLSDKKYPVTIKESEFDSSKYSKNPKDCEAEDKEIKVCRLSDKKYPVTIKESEFDSSNYSKSESDCAETPKCEVPGKKHLPADSKDCEEDTPTELPHTGPVEAFASLLGAGALTGTTATYLRSRRAR